MVALITGFAVFFAVSAFGVAFTTDLVTGTAAALRFSIKLTTTFVRWVSLVDIFDSPIKLSVTKCPYIWALAE